MRLRGDQNPLILQEANRPYPGVCQSHCDTKCAFSQTFDPSSKTAFCSGMTPGFFTFSGDDSVPAMNYSARFENIGGG
jgi:hypothetical protein